MCANLDLRGLRKFHFECTAVLFVRRVPLRVKIFHSFIPIVYFLLVRRARVLAGRWVHPEKVKGRDRFKGVQG